MPALAAWIAAMLSRYLIVKAGFFVASILAFIGVQMVTQEVVIDPILDYVRNIGGSLPPVAAQWFAFFNVDRYITIIFSAYTVGEGRNFVFRKIGA